ncbi:hypothetical protein [Thermofilum sp.]|uniref:hypothetical protein n=1 Tax=Thermofilum sp. TaxID=1961369 RepID=UPI00315E6E2B
MSLQIPVGYTISYDKETGKLVLEIFDLKTEQEHPASGHFAEIYMEGETAPKRLKIMFPDYKSLVAYLLYSVLYK